jgi:hypothetical protein
MHDEARRIFHEFNCVEKITANLSTPDDHASRDSIVV